MRQRGSGLTRSAALWRYALTAVLGLPRRPQSGPRRAATSSFEVPMEAANALQFGRAYWLSPFGRGNGVERCSGHRSPRSPTTASTPC